MDKRSENDISVRMAVARDKLKSAQILFDNGQYPDAVSRAYYAMYYAAAAVLLLKGQKPKTHQGVLNLFGRFFVKQGEVDKNYSLMLRVVQDMREDADYKPEIVINEQDARDSIDKAGSFIEQCGEAITRHSKEES